MKLRKCTVCGQEKPATLEHFSAQASADGFRLQCKICYNAERREAARIKREPPPVRPVKHSWEALGMEYRDHKVFDPFAMGNRYEGSRV